MSERRRRAFLRHAALPATILLLITIALWLLWRQSHPTDMPVADRRLHELYALEPGEVIRLLPPPGIPERARYNIPTRVGQLPNPSLTLRWDGHVAQARSLALGGHPIDRVLHQIGLDGAACEIDPTLNLRIPGDLIVRSPAPLDEKIVALESILKSVTARTIRIERRPTQREVIIVTGSFAQKQLPFPTQTPSTIHLYADATFRDRPRSGYGSGRVPALLQSVGKLLDRPVIDRSTSPPGTAVLWSIHVNPRQIDGDDAALEQFLQNLSTQTSLTFTRQKQPAEKYFVREVK